MHILIYAAAACVFSEFVGYWVHILLHSHRVPFLSRNHMIHHLVVYSPDRPLRPSASYIGSTEDRANLLGIGLEWVLPLGAVFSAVLVAFHFVGVRAVDQAVFLGIAVAWGFSMFGYFHDAMHMKGTWLERSPLFKHARKLHDIHHLNLTDDGTMAYNFGICFFFFDRVFRSFREEHVRFNVAGFAAARKRYAYVLTP
jgi:sterol desaturase/sphingolipid hydroxylase (fatty acid hydroxylase superfamily)